MGGTNEFLGEQIRKVYGNVYASQTGLSFFPHGHKNLLERGFLAALLPEISAKESFLLHLLIFKCLCFKIIFILILGNVSEPARWHQNTFPPIY